MSPRRELLPALTPLRFPAAFGAAIYHVWGLLSLGNAWLPFTGRKSNAFNSPSWTLSAEWFFYLLLPLLIPALTSGSLRRRAAVVVLVLTPWAVAVAGLFGSTLLGPITPFRYP